MYGIKTISDLQKNAPKLRFASQGEFDEREDGLPGLEKVYGRFVWKSSAVYDNGLKYQIIDNNEADVAPAYTTEGMLADAEKFLLLEDDKHMWPPYNLAPVVRDEILSANPEIGEILNRINTTLDTETITALNAKVDIEKEEVEDVATSGVGIAFMKLVKGRYPDLKITGTSRIRKKEVQLLEEGFDEINEMFEFIIRYHIDVRPEKVFALNEASEAHRYLEGQNSFGKIILKM